MPSLEVHVARAIPGDVVDARIEHRSPHRPVAWARLLRVVAPSRFRVETPCPHYGTCGGCALMAQRYDVQLVAKAARLRRALGPEAPIDLVTPSPAIWRYRRTAKYVVVRRGGRTILGSYEPRSHRVADMRGCLVVEPPIAAVADEIAALADQTGARLRHVVLRAGAGGEVLCTLVVRAPEPEQAELARLLRERRPEVVGVVRIVHAAEGNAILPSPDADADADAGTNANDAIDEVLAGAGVLDDGVPLWPRTFAQVNRAQSEALYAAVVEQAGLTERETVLDLYCGAGALTARLAARAARVVAVDVAPAPPGPFRFVRADVEAFLRGPDAPAADVVVANPPRKGIGPSVAAALARLAPRRIVYVSCCPETLARDVAHLAPAFALRAVLPFDLMPQTPEVEAVAVFDRSDA